MKLAILTLLGLALLPAAALASLKPSTLTLRWGFDEGPSTVQPEYSNVPALSTTWPLGKKVSLWSGASYFQESTNRFIGGSDHIYSRYLPLSVGLRVHALNAEGQQRGPFAEFGPSIVPAWYRGRTGSTGSALMGGLQAGTGFRMPSLDGTRAELGLSYYLAEAFGEHVNAYSRIGTPRQVDVSVFSVYIALGIGD